MTSTRTLAVSVWLLFGALGCSASDSSYDGKTASSAQVEQTAAELCAELTCGDESQLEPCKESLSEYISAAETYSCLDVLDSWLSCLGEASSCEDGEALQSSDGACAEEEELAEDCRKGRL